MRARFLGKDPDSQVENSPTLFATDRTDRRTYIAQGWVVTDPQALGDIGPIPEGEAIIEIPEDVLKFYLARPGGGAALTRLIRQGRLRQLFETFEHTAFRLEVRDRYDAPYENESLRKFLAGEPDDLPWMQGWLGMIRDRRPQGRTFRGSGW